MIFDDLYYIIGLYYAFYCTCTIMVGSVVDNLESYLHHSVIIFVIAIHNYWCNNLVYSMGVERRY